MSHTISAELPERGVMRLKQVLEFIPVSRAEIYRRIADGRFPQPTRLSQRVSVWPVSAIREYLKQAESQSI